LEIFGVDWSMELLRFAVPGILRGSYGATRQSTAATVGILMGVLLMIVAFIVAVVENGLLQAVLFAVVAFEVVLPLLAAILKPR
jgi:hypothetical protein